MLNNSRVFLGFILLIATTIVGWLVFALPSYCSAEAIAQEAAQLQRQAIRYTDLAYDITQQNVELMNTVRSRSAQINDLPAVPDIPGLLKELELSFDQETVWDQLFTVGQSRDAVIDSELGLSYAPITIDMVSNFSAIFALIIDAESQSRPLRVASVTITRFAASEIGDPSNRLRASIVLELLYSPESGGEDS